MHVFSKVQIFSPIVTNHGEIIFDLLGRNFVQRTENHSVAHVLIPPDKASLLHYHPEAEESYYILKGKARILIGDEEATVAPGEIILIPPGKSHKIFNVSEDNLEFLVICVPAWEPNNTVLLE